MVSSTTVTIWTKLSSPISNLVRYGKTFRQTIRRDMKALRYVITTQSTISKLKRSNSTVWTVFQTMAAQNAQKAALIHHGQVWTYSELDKFSNKIANAFRDAGFKPGDEVALLMESKPEFVGIWLGLSKIGCVTALLNTYLKPQNLLHSISVVKAKALIYDSQFQPEIDILQSIKPKERDIKFLSYGDYQINNSATSLSHLLNLSSDQPVDYKGDFTDRLLYIFTSGTTGLPKAAIISNARFFVFGIGIHLITEMKPDDIIYTPLPLYHFAGGVLGLSQCLMYGNSVVLRHKFSASTFWEDCIKYNCTVAQYIGETSRYLLVHPKNENGSENKHKIRCVYGNGFRPQLWAPFRERFGIKKIVEFYGATEGNTSLANIDNRDGACGFLSVLFPDWLLNRIYPANLIKVDEDTGEPLRSPDGLCIKCRPGETGQFVGMIKNNNPIKRFDGYSEEDKTAKKIIHNVFKHGDSYYASGDLLEMDNLGYVYFRDRTGDNFRWKGENVSTGEIEVAISECLNLADCAVYGVKVANYEGRAGMAAIAKPASDINLNQFLEQLKSKLPHYAIPVFIRIVDKIEMTSTFKIPKNVLQKEAYDISLVKDPLFYLDWKNSCYKKIGKDEYEKLVSGKISL